jgi:hypothetical protein
VRASSIKLFAVIALSLIILFSLVAFGNEESVYASIEGKEINYGSIKTREDRISFIEGFGLKVDKNSEKEESFVMPESFDRVILGYNELQKEQGLNLTKYKNKEVTRYTFTVTNYEGYDGTVYANVLVYRNRVIGGDVCSADVTGFVQGFEKK